VTSFEARYNDKVRLSTVYSTDLIHLDNLIPEKYEYCGCANFEWYTKFKTVEIPKPDGEHFFAVSRR
jgi:hypothetical protein